jgi:signal transduction histidine kinase
MQHALVHPICIGIDARESSIDCPHGMGMSLAIRRSIIEARDGRLRATKIETRRATLALTLSAYSSASQ